VVGDWAGNGVTKVGVFWNGLWYLDKSVDGIWNGTPMDINNINFGSGLPNVLPIVYK